MASLPEHPNIVGHYRAWQQDGHFYIQMDVCEGGSLGSISAAVRHTHTHTATDRHTVPGTVKSVLMLQRMLHLLHATHRRSSVGSACRRRCFGW